MVVAVFLIFLLCASHCAAQEEEPLRAFLTGIANRQLAERRDAIKALRTPEDVQRRPAEVRQKILRMMGGLPDERGPLNVRRTGSLDRDGYRVEKIVYESLPDFYVTASLYIPTQGSPPYPAVLQPIGHSQTGKARGLYQSLSIGLAKNGYVVLTYDPIGQGERTIFYDKRLETSVVGSSTREHQMVGVQSLLAGESVARYRVWDGIRGIDLLQSLPEVDRSRIGLAGCSGGGTLTAYLAVLDDRIKVAAPACYISSWEEQLKGTGPQDAEQQFPDQLAEGIDHGDFALAFAPKPYLICNTTEDFFPLEGGRQTFEEARAIYTLLGAGEKIDRFVGPGGHGMRRDTREAIYAWMNRWLKGESGPVAEPEHTLEYDEDLYVTETGEVAKSLGGETASTWNIKRFAQIQPARPRSDIREAVVKLTRYQQPSGPLHIRTQSREKRDGYETEALLYDAEPGRSVPASLCTPDAGRSLSQTVLYAGTGAAELCAQGYTVLAVDLAGTGRTASNWGSYSSDWFGSDKVTWLALMVGRPLIGLRMADLVRGLDVLAERELLLNGKAAGVAKGTPGVAFLHAAVIDPRLERLTLEDPLVSYRALATTPVHRQIFDAVIPGVLGEYDLQDLVAAVAPRPVSLLNVRSPMGRLMRREEVREEYRHAGDALHIGLRREGEPLSLSGGIRSATYTYKQVGSLGIKADVLRPDDDKMRPVVVWIHGGALIMGHRAGVSARVRQTMLDAGYVIVSIDYRLAPETKLPEIVEDVEDAFSWLRREGPRLFHADTSKIAVMGGSAGGYLTLTTGYRVQPRPAALVAFWGYGDLVGDWYSQPSTHARHQTPKMTEDEAWRQVSGSPVSDSRERSGNGAAFYQYCRQQGLWPKAVSGWDPHSEVEKFVPFMPVRNVTSSYPPTLLIHGTDDTDVPYQQSGMMAEQFKRHGVEHQLITISGGEHGLGGGDPKLIDEAYRAAFEFVQRHLTK